MEESLNQIQVSVTSTCPTSQTLSSRSIPYLQANPRFYYSKCQVEAIANQYHPVSNPDGAIPLAVAENKQNTSMLVDKINSFTGYSENIANYTWSSGLPSAREVFAQFLSKYLFSGYPVLADELVLCPGCVSILHQLSILLCEAGDCVLIPTPYYPAFDHDFWNMGHVITVEVNRPVVDGGQHFDYALSVDALEAAYQEQRNQGRKVKALLLTNPSNPLGIIYSDAELLSAIAWARSKGIHIIMDEIYALSVFDDSREDHKFTSAVVLLDGKTADDVHVLWSLSKDFGGSGLRCAAFFSQNQQLIRAMSGQNDAFMMSNLMQECAAFLLSDHVFIDHWIAIMRVSLTQSYVYLSQALEEIDIPIIKGGAGIFVFANFRKYLHQDSYDGEKALHAELYRRGVVLTPGHSCHAQLPGYFRICFAWVPLTSLQEAVRRVTAFTIDFQQSSSK